MTSPAWWGVYPILTLYAVYAVWLGFLGCWWAAAYWVFAGALTICSMKGLLPS